jgi:hypothetical protein
MKLKNEQIKQTGLAMIAFSEGKKVEAAYVQSPNSWHDVDFPNWQSQAAIFRPKPQPVSRPWSKPEDVPLNCWLRICGTELFYLVTYLSPDWIGGNTLGRIAWDNLHGYEYSTDRKTWKPCTVEDAQ